MVTTAFGREPPRSGGSSDDLDYRGDGQRRLLSPRAPPGLPEEIPDRRLGPLSDYARQAGPSTDTVARILDCPALTYAEWASEHAAAFRD